MWWANERPEGVEYAPQKLLGSGPHTWLLSLQP